MKTYTNKFGKTISVGQECVLCRRFSTERGEKCIITEITPSGKYFKVDKHPNLFSTQTFNCKGSHLGNTYIQL